jgi:HD superfamily phosphohydrolase
VNYDRIINKLNVVDHELVVEVKGIYSVEKFITARRLMYWQVYLHKTTVGAESLITNILNRAKYLTRKGKQITSFEPLHYFLANEVSPEEFSARKDIVETFVMLDDFDIMSEIKRWTLSNDLVLKTLCCQLLYRDLWRVEKKSQKSKSAAFINVLALSEVEVCRNEAIHLGTKLPARYFCNRLRTRSD